MKYKYLRKEEDPYTQPLNQLESNYIDSNIKYYKILFRISKSKKIPKTALVTVGKEIVPLLINMYHEEFYNLALGQQELYEKKQRLMVQKQSNIKHFKVQKKNNFNLAQDKQKNKEEILDNIKELAIRKHIDLLLSTKIKVIDSLIDNKQE